MAEYLKKASGVAKIDQITNSIGGFKINDENTEGESSDFYRDSHYCPAGKIVQILQRPGGIASIWIEAATLEKLEPQVEIFILKATSIINDSDVLLIGHVANSFNKESSLMYQIKVMASEMYWKELKMGMKVYFQHYEKCSLPLVNISLERKQFSKVAKTGTRFGSHMNNKDNDHSYIQVRSPVGAEGGSRAGSRFGFQVGAGVDNNTIAEINNVSQGKPQVDIPMGYQPVWSNDSMDEIPTFIVPKLYPHINIRVQIPGSTDTIGTFTFVPAQGIDSLKPDTSASNLTNGAQVGSQLKDLNLGKGNGFKMLSKGFQGFIKKQKIGQKYFESRIQVGSREVTSAEVNKEQRRTNQSPVLANDFPSGKSIPRFGTQMDAREETTAKLNTNRALVLTNDLSSGKSIRNLGTQMGAREGISVNLNRNRSPILDNDLPSGKSIQRAGSQPGAQKELVKELSEEFGPQVRKKIDFLIEESNRGSQAVLEVETEFYNLNDLANLKKVTQKNEIIESSMAEDLGFELI